MHNLLKLSSRTAPGGRTCCRRQVVIAGKKENKIDKNPVAWPLRPAQPVQTGLENSAVAKPALWQAGVAENKMVAEFMKWKT